MLRRTLNLSYHALLRVVGTVARGVSIPRILHFHVRLRRASSSSHILNSIDGYAHRKVPSASELLVYVYVLTHRSVLGSSVVAKKQNANDCSNTKSDP